ncbi:5933_t:CDS:2, partial [Paraglomus brasilianum]
MTFAYNDTHRLFLQASIAERIFSETTAEEMYRKSCEATSVEYEIESFDDFMAALNDRLHRVDMEFRKSHDEENGNTVWALVNTNGDEVAKLATEYSPNEIAFFRRILELIVTADGEAFSVSSISALREGPLLKPQITKTATEALLQKFVDDKWLIRSSSGRYSMSARAILELQSLLKEEFEDYILECTLCYEIVTKGQRCKTTKCKARFHHHCAQ